MNCPYWLELAVSASSECLLFNDWHATVFSWSCDFVTGVWRDGSKTTKTTGWRSVIMRLPQRTYATAVTSSSTTPNVITSWRTFIGRSTVLFTTLKSRRKNETPTTVLCMLNSCGAFRVCFPYWNNDLVWMSKRKYTR